MGLDMYLERMPRYKNLKADDIANINGYFSWIAAKEEGSKYANCTLEEWCGASIDNIPEEAIKFYEQFNTVKYQSWDTEHKYGRAQIYESVGYWRKANAIHKWFVDNVQDGEDDCGYYEVTKEKLEELLDICIQVRDSSRMEEIAQELLPTQCGFFFGSTAYDEWYVDDLIETISILTKALKETDFDNQMVVYVSSW